MRSYLRALATLEPEAPPTSLSTAGKWRRERDEFLKDRARKVVSLWCIPCGRDVATIKAGEIGQAALTRFAIEARDHDNALSCGGLYEFVTYRRKGKGERRRLEGVPKSDPRQLPQWRALIELLFRRLKL
ncbi:MAG: hypothetical protein ACHP7H_00595 [Hyphomicrobiales bacterium]